MYIYNSLNNKLEKFKSIEKNKVGIYVCGPTVYNYIHIGNLRPVIVFDTLARYLKSLGYEVKFIQNFTDIDDKIIKSSLEENTNIEELTNKYIKAFLEDISQFNILKDVIRPKVSENIDEILEMIQKLIDNGYAYVNNGDVLFKVNKFKEYGKLSNQNINELISGARIKSGENKESSLDFVLWKKKKENEPYWESPWSQGRPGWHIECSAMAHKYLGNNFDIHAGGIDLIFPHHENEIAQSRCSCNEKNHYAKYWMHNGHLEINGEKMSKSLGNFKLVREILKKYSGNIIRLFLLSTHYRKPINFNFEYLESTKKSLYYLINTIKRYSNIENITKSENKEIIKLINNFELNFKNAMDDDLNTPLAIASIHEFIKLVNKEINIKGYTKEILDVANLIKYKLEDILGVELMIKNNNNLEEKLIELLNKVRDIARNNKNYELSDMIRDELKKLGLQISDGKVKNV